ncbi:MAG: hypothetical protein ABI405_10845 [Parafilimonas sp.]
MMGMKEAQNVKAVKSFTGTTITINGNDVISDSNYYFIGETKEYIFFYNEKTNSPTIYPMEKVEKIQYVVKDFKSYFRDHPSKKPDG